ncbi:hypothetical protein PCANC_17737 [Puccinia coronata f. sp. avenae]|uniref:DUF659 domain-containing protein n=1 Tax=Puccinia coronata f. sp. avenae TaxID=200324 RepID=A0A2N5UYS0_9BASI|nr:hypothetical protein PCANC_17737 [Puccinia coronata f. sp. avenae]
MNLRPRKKARHHTSPPSSSASDPIQIHAPLLQVNELHNEETPSASGCPTPLKDLEALSRAQNIAKTTVSSSYSSYSNPELSNQLNKNGRQMIVCGTKINSPMTNSSCSNLLKYAAICLKKNAEKEQNCTLALLGVTGTGQIDPRQVNQICAIWCAEAARPFSSLEDESLKRLLHPTVLKNLPNQHAVSQSIHILYTAVPESFKLELKNKNGAFYLGVDAWQSPNGFDILGIVISWLNEGRGLNQKLESMPLDFIKISRSHTGKYLEEMVQLVVKKFGVQNKSCGIVSDNASNNAAMVDKLKKLKWPRNFKGEPHWIRCFAHVLN